MALAKSALQSLNQAYDLFQQVGEKSRTAKVLVRPIIIHTINLVDNVSNVDCISPS